MPQVSRKGKVLRSAVNFAEDYRPVTLSRICSRRVLVLDFACVGAPTFGMPLRSRPSINGTLFCWRLEVLTFSVLFIFSYVHCDNFFHMPSLLVTRP